jgi:hypothetical protein
MADMTRMLDRYSRMWNHERLLQQLVLKNAWRHR